ncbi:PREDICTED: S-linalool synthase-like [Nelumbo nucifera]|uniref:S-linalool synthase-like n=1 Tax=Nelumbo nucifera TaxID=4432 RepID=A0A1U8BMW0_NELNU|nr:PREDICTED: S-linalool synthase-like [Nelumbo nucifera]
MRNVYKATDLILFLGEDELEEARSLSRKLLEKAISFKATKNNDTILLPPRFWRLVEHELRLQWCARMDHLEHRMCIEVNKTTSPLMGKSSLYRQSFLHIDNVLLQLAWKNYLFRQSIYRSELDELKSWSKESGLASTGFGREKTTYCYYAISSCSSIPLNSDVRMTVAKSAIIVTVADDFYDMEGSFMFYLFT